jgi:hypothetical protein
MFRKITCLKILKLNNIANYIKGMRYFFIFRSDISEENHQRQIYGSTLKRDRWAGGHVGRVSLTLIPDLKNYGSL